jgi:hypothetical protein
LLSIHSNFKKIKMQLSIKTYSGQKADFYIQAKGLHAGRPLKHPKVNSFAVNTNITNAYEVVFSLWKGKAFKNYIIGSVVPFIRVSSVKEIVSRALSNIDKFDKKNLETIAHIDEHIKNLETQIKLLKQCQVDLAAKGNKCV